MTIPTRLDEKYPPKTKFGRGFLICILKFVEHAEDYLRWKEKPELFSIPENYWFYTASDHLLNLELPEQLKGTKIEQNVNELKSYLSERLGHNLKKKDVIKMFDLCREIALLLDRRFGLQPDLGKR
jgi:hypothetical protein